MWIKRLLLFCLILGQAGLAHAQGQLVSGQAIVNTTTSVSGIPGNTVLQAVPNAQITVCSALGGGIPCAPLVTIYANSTLSVIAPNPLTTDANGNFAFYVPPLSAGYIYSQTGSGIVGQLFPIAGSVSSGGGSTTPGSPGGSFQFNSGGVFTGAAGVTTPDGGNSIDIKGPIPWIDATAYGVRALALFNTITVSTPGGSPILTTGGVSDFQVNDGIVIPKAGAATAQSTPAAPTVTPIGATGSSTISYECVGVDAHWGLTAASPAGTTTTAPAVFGIPAVGITSIARAGNVVTVTSSSTMAFNTGTFHAVIANVTGGSTQFSGLQLVTVTSGTTLTYPQTGTNESGTVSASSYILFENAFVLTTVQASAGSNQIVLTTDVNHNIQFSNSGTRPTKIFLDGINFAGATPPGYANGLFVVAGVTANTITITTQYVSPTTVAGTASSTFATSGVAQMTATVFPLVDVQCPAITGTTKYYAVYGNYGSGFAPIGFTPWLTTTLEDYGPAFTQTGFVPPTSMNLPATPPVAAQNQTFSGQIQTIVGSTITLTGNVPTMVSGVTAYHDNGVPLQNAVAASCSNGGGGGFGSQGDASVYLPRQALGATSSWVYLFNAPVDLSATCGRVSIVDGGSVQANGTIYADNAFSFEWKKPSDLSGRTLANQAAGDGVSYFGFASPLMVAGVNNATVSGMAFTTLSNGQIGLDYLGNNSHFWNDQFMTGGTLDLTAVPFEIVNAAFEVDIGNVFVAAGRRIQYPIAQSGSSVELGQVAYWPVPAVDILGPQFPITKFGGINYVNVRGIQMDNLYNNTSNPPQFWLSDFETVQAPWQPLFTIYGASGSGINRVDLTRIQMDSIQMPDMSCAALGGCITAYTSDAALTQGDGTDPSFTGSASRSVLERLTHNAAPAQNVNECSYTSSPATFNCTMSIASLSFAAGATPPLAVCGTASGAICFGSGTVPCVPTAGQACIQYDKTTDRFLYTLDGSPLAALVGSTGAPIDLTAQSAAIAATNINNSVPTTAVYRLCFSAAITTVGSVSSTLGGANGFQVIYTSPTDSVVKTTVPNTAWSSAANTTGTAVGGCQEVYAKAATPLQYSFGYTSNAGGTMIYELHIREEDGN